MKDKNGKEITIGEFFKRWGQGIKNVTSNPTPLERLTIERNGTLITLMGLIISLIVLIIYRDKFVVEWFSYGLMLIFIGNIITTNLKLQGVREQLKRIKEFERGTNGYK